MNAGEEPLKRIKKYRDFDKRLSNTVNDFDSIEDKSNGENLLDYTLQHGFPSKVAKMDRGVQKMKI